MQTGSTVGLGLLDRRFHVQQQLDHVASPYLALDFIGVEEPRAAHIVFDQLGGTVRSWSESRGYSTDPKPNGGIDGCRRRG